MPDSIGSSDDNSYLKQLEEKLKRVIEIQAELVSAIKEVQHFDNRSTFFEIETKIKNLLKEFPNNKNNSLKDEENYGSAPATFPRPNLGNKD